MKTVTSFHDRIERTDEEEMHSSKFWKEVNKLEKCGGDNSGLTAFKYRIYLGCVGTPLISEGLFSEMKPSQPRLSLCISQNTRRYLKQTKIQSVAFPQPRQKFLKMTILKTWMQKALSWLLVCELVMIELPDLDINS